MISTFCRFCDYFGFRNNICDNSLFIYSNGLDVAYLLLYVDDIILTASSDALRLLIMAKLSAEFAMKDLGSLSYFLGIAVTHNAQGLFLSQSKYAANILDRAGMTDRKYTPTPVATTSKLSASSNAPYADLTLYRAFAGALQYLTFIKPDIFYVVQQVYLFMHDLKVEHMAAFHRILWYLKGTLDHGFQFYKSPIFSLLYYTDADWGGCPDTRCSTSGYCVFLEDNLISWSLKR